LINLQQKKKGRLVMHVKRAFPVLAAIALFGMACGDDDATGIPSDVEIFRATMNGANEVPTLPAGPTTATGTATMTVLGNLVSWRVEVTNINNVSLGHIHAGDAATAGGVMVNLSPAIGSVTTTTVISQGSAVVDDTVLVRMRAGTAYVNIHTNDGVAPTNTGPGDYPGGEIRGQLRKQ
jgi:hypothetical protein